MRFYVLGFLGVSLWLAACGGGGSDNGVTPPPPPPPPPPLTASLEGIVTDEGDGSRVPGAMVTVGTSSVTTQSDGSFSFTGLSQGVVSIRVAAPGFNPLQTGTTLTAGTNTRTLVIMRDNVLWESSGWATYIPYGVASVRGVFVFFYGGSLDARPMIRGDVQYYASIQAFPDGALRTAEHRRRLLAFARAHGFALMGTENPLSPSSLYADIRTALDDVGQRSGRTALTQAPLLILGHSRGGCMAYQLAVQAGDNVIGVLPLASDGVNPCLEGSPHPDVPVYMIVGEFDLSGILPSNLRVFEEHRTRGELWAFGVEAGRPHSWPVSNDVLFHWAEAVTLQRLPATTPPGAPVQLRTISESSGWLADRTSFAIGSYLCFTGEKRRASWIPNEQTAREWRSMTSPTSTPVIINCAQ